VAPVRPTTKEEPNGQVQINHGGASRPSGKRFPNTKTGHAPKSVTVVLSEDTLVVTLHGALSPAEQVLSKSAAGAAQVQEFHRQLFASSADPLRQEIKRITGVDVREATAEVETTTGTVVQVFTTGTMVQVFLLAQRLSTETWTGSGPGSVAENKKHAASEHHHKAAVEYETVAYHHRQAAHHHDNGNHEEAKKHATSAHEHSQDAGRHSKTAQQNSQK
jgi:uncharacterized protein YbcI